MSEETSTTTEATNDLGLPQGTYDRLAAFQDEPYPGDEVFEDQADAGELTLNKADAYNLRYALHAAVSELATDLQMSQMFGGITEDQVGKTAERFERFLDLNDRLVAITEEAVPAGV